MESIKHFIQQNINKKSQKERVYAFLIIAHVSLPASLNQTIILLI